MFSAFGASSARAQDGFSIDRFDPSERGSEWFVSDTLDFREDVRPAIGVVADYALKPLVFYDNEGNEGPAVVKHQLYLHLGGSLVLFERLRLAVNLPVAALVRGDETNGSVGGVPITVDEGGGLGDLRLSADLRLFGEYRGLITGAFGVSFWAPTGSQDAFTGDGRVRIAPHFNLAGEVAIFAWAAKIGANVRLQDGDLAGSALGSELFLSGALGLRLADGRLLLGPELWASTVFQDGLFRRAGTPFEAIFGAHYTAGPVRIGAGAGPGFTEGYGSPKMRAVASVEWIPEVVVPPSDRDGDGIIDELDACPDTPGIPSDDPQKHGCPETDRDQDGILDDDDACPDTPGVANYEDPAKHGCPILDRDDDGILDDVDACPDERGVPNDDPTKHGCPLRDRDNDGILDDVDACPDVPGPANVDPEKNGCPAARIENDQIRILEQVRFKTNSSEILPESDPIMQAVLTILEEHPDIEWVSIEGHTDSRGRAAYNKKLSQARANSVMEWLVSRGIDDGRLTAVGYGLERPIADNETAEGRLKNRRVEFHIREVEGTATSDERAYE